MIKCPVCDKEYDESLAECPVCAFPTVSFLHASEEERNRLRQLADEYRKVRYPQKKQTGERYTRIFLYVYENQMDEERREVRLRDISGVYLGDLETLTPGTISWYPERFAMQAGEGASSKTYLTIRLYTKKAMINGLSETAVEKYGKTQTVMIDQPPEPGFRHVGIGVEKDGNFRLYLGNSENYTCTEPIKTAVEG